MRSRVLVRSLHSPDFSLIELLVQFRFGFVLESSNILHGHSMPFVEPAIDLSVEIGEESPFCDHDEVLHSGLKSEPFKLARNQLVRAHDRHGRRGAPVTDEGTASSLLGLDLGRILLRLVVAALHRIVGDVDVHDLFRRKTKI